MISQTKKVLNKYYLKDGIVFSDLKKKFEIITKDYEIEIDSSYSFPKSNELLLEKLKDFQKKTFKKIEISGIIENFEEFKKKLLKINIKNYSKTDDDKYLFIEFTSQIEILKGYIISLENQYLKKIDSSINLYLKETCDIEKGKNASLKKNISSNEEKNKKYKLEIKNIENHDMLKINDELKQKQKQKITLENKNKLLESQIYTNNNNNNNNLEIQKIEIKINYYEGNCEDLNLQAKIYETRIKKLKIDLKRSKTKQFLPLSFFLTLGLIYWTKFSNTKYQILMYEEKIYSIEEKTLELKRKIKNSKNMISDILRKNENEEKGSVKKQDLLISKFEKRNIELNSINKELKILEKELKRKKEKIGEYEYKSNEIENNLEKLKNLEKHYKDISSQNLRKMILDLRLKNKKTIIELEEMKRQLESQKSFIKEDLIVEL